MSSHPDRFHDSAAERPDDESTVSGEQGQSTPANDPAADSHQRQLRLDAIRQAIEDGVYDHDDLFDRALQRMVGHDDFVTEDSDLPHQTSVETSAEQLAETSTEMSAEPPSQSPTDPSVDDHRPSADRTEDSPSMDDEASTDIDQDE